MLKCAGNRIYTGYAVDVEARFKQHVSGKGARFTKAFPPECILRTFELNSKEEALRLEARIKMLDRPHKELLVGLSGSDSADASGSTAAAESLVAQLMAGLSETLQETKARAKKARAKKGD
ncbi:MAG: GIY-YIG nuclease family protein [Fibrobacter sp.]|nr:GIY-YIG nuclease family protein [Fibrobacter sp.]